jgi:hypothetical protein
MAKDPRPDYSTEAEIAELLRVAKKLNLEVGEVERSGSELNFVAIRTKNVLISRRLDSRTLLIQDFRYGRERGYGVFTGSDKVLRDCAKRCFEALGIATGEADEWQVLTEQTQTARAARRDKFVMGRVMPGAKLLRVLRRVAGIPVWSSNLTLRLTGRGTVAFLQCHWPDLSQTALDEARRLHYLVQHGWQPPAREGASPEQIEAGIRHSPPVALSMDVVPAVRVIYRPWNQQFGRKLTLYFDRHGREAPRVRHAAELPRLDVRARPPQGGKEGPSTK